MRWAFFAIFGIWFSLSAISQMRLARTRWIRRFDFFGLVPAWNFFAPRPIVTDYFVSYRVWTDASTAPSEWHRLQYPGRRRVLDGIFNSRRRSRKALWDCANSLLTTRRRLKSRVPPSDPAYLRLLARTSRDARKREDAMFIQFRVTWVRGAHLATPVEKRWFLSGRHRL